MGRPRQAGGSPACCPPPPPAGPSSVSCSQPPSKAGISIALPGQLRKLRPREGEELPRGHTAFKAELGFDSSSLIPGSAFSPTALHHITLAAAWVPRPRLT